MTLTSIAEALADTAEVRRISRSSWKRQWRSIQILMQCLSGGMECKWLAFTECTRLMSPDMCGGTMYRRRKHKLKGSVLVKL